MKSTALLVTAALLGVCNLAHGGTLRDGFRCKKTDECQDGLSCIGPPEHLRCKMKKPLGGQCGDPTWVCQPGLDCETKEGQRYGTCVDTKPHDEPCNHKWYRCAKGTQCIKGKCGKPNEGEEYEYEEDEYPWKDDPDDEEPPVKKPPVIKPPVKKTPPKYCTPGKNQCPRGTRCVGHRVRKICKKPMQEGESCQDVTWVCAYGLKCVGKGKKAVCRKPAPPLKKNAKTSKVKSKRCIPGKNQCPRGTRCVGHLGRKICKKPVQEGESCQDITWVCAYGMKCLGKGKKAVCRRPAPPAKKTGKVKAKRCIPGKTQCPQGTRCVGRRGRMVCKKPMQEGESCRDVTWVCAPGLKCVGRGKKAVCRGKPKRMSESKDKRAIVAHGCGKGRYLMIYRGKVQCVRLTTQGKVCGSKEAVWCKVGLVCRRPKKGPARCVRVARNGNRCGLKQGVACGKYSKCVGAVGKKRCVSQRKK